MREAYSRIRDPFPAAAWALIWLGIGLRVLYWHLYPPIWKLHAVFNLYQVSVLEYVSNFQGYKPDRMPFFDVVSALFHYLFGGVLGVASLTLFSVLIACLSLFAFYLAAEHLFDATVATYALALFALYPKYLVLSARGMPEAASAAVVVFTVYGVTVARSTGRHRYYFVTGILATASYLLFLPAVIFAVVTALWIAVDRHGLRPSADVLLDRGLLAYSAVPGAIGLLYLAFGPLVTASENVFSGDAQPSLFADPAAYGFVEKIVRYAFFAYFDFWWHLRGFDTEPLFVIESLQGLFGTLFPVYFLGWLAITGTLSVLVVLGVVTFARRRDLVSAYLVVWIVFYVAVYNLRNTGFTGAFQTRHVFPLFPALCLAFGVGAYCAVRAVSSRVSLSRSRIEFVVTGLLVASLLILIVNGAAQGAIRGEKHTEEFQEPALEVEEIVGQDESVGVVTLRDYQNHVVYTENRVRPVVLVDPEYGDPAAVARYTVDAQIEHVEQPYLETCAVDYLYLRVQHAYPEQTPYQIDVNRELLDDVEASDVIYHKYIPRGSYRTTDLDIYLVDLSSNRC